MTAALDTATPAAPIATGRVGVLGLYSAALRRAAASDGAALDLVDRYGRPLQQLDPARWFRLDAADRTLLARCAGPTLDVGCGPGRLAAALADVGLPALGVDVCAEAVRQARRRGAAALRRDVFAPLPGEGRWRHVLLADGNIGIGGDPARLLRRCRALLRRDGSLFVETGSPDTPGWRAGVALRDGAGRTSDAFAWAVVSAEEIAGLAARTGLRLLDTWMEAHRWFAALAPC